MNSELTLYGITPNRPPTSNKQKTLTVTDVTAGPNPGLAIVSILAIIFSMFSVAANAATYYIAPGGSDAASGDITHPFYTINKAWSKVVAGDQVYLRGGTYAYNSTQVLTNKSGTAGNLIKIWAYPGEFPILTKALPFVDTWAAGISISETNYLHLKGFEITGFSQPSDGALSVWPAIHVHNASHNIFELINSHHNGHGMVMRGDFGTLDDNLVLNCDFHHNSDPYSTTAYDNADGIEIAYCSSGTTTLRGCRSWSNSDDGYDLWANNGIVNTEDCWSFWNGYSDNGISQTGIGEGFKAGGITCAVAPTVLKRTYTKCLAFGNTNNGFADNNSQFKMKFVNCIAYHNVQLGTPYLVGFHVSATTTSQNIFTNCISYANQWTNGGLNDRPVYIDPSSVVTTSSFISDRFVNPAYTVSNADFVNLDPSGLTSARQSDGSLPVITFLHLAAGSDLINSGTNVGLPFNDANPDLGAFEYTSTTTNNPPVITNQSFSIAENSVSGIAVGTVVATDQDAGQTKTFSILSGNTNSAFAINASTGAITVATSSALNYEATASFALVIKVQDNGTGSLSSQATITVSLLDVNEVPAISNQVFALNENSAIGIAVGNVTATDPDAGQTKTFSILSGNTNSAFVINASTGALTVATSSTLNYEAITSFALVIKVQDNGTGSLSSQATITVSLLDVNEVPAISNQVFALNENSAIGIAVGNVTATDPDAGQTKTFSILSGNTNSAFAINASTGVITVATSSALNYEAAASFALVIKVQDNGTGSLSSQATITVSLLDVNEVPAISNQAFSLNENSGNGMALGIVAASDPDAGQTKTFSILSGNTNNAFAINASTGALTVATSSTLNYEAITSFALVIKVQDNGTGSLSSQATITVSLLDVNEVPAISNQVFALNENSANGMAVGTVTATDPDAGQTKTFSILSGNTNSAFAINSSTGALSVATSSALDYEVAVPFALVIKVQDNGTGNLSSQATINISLLDVNEVPAISNQVFALNENSANGMAVGTVTATDPDAGQTKIFSILSGNTNSAFAINSSTGALSVATSSALDYEVAVPFALVIKVQDNGTGNLSSQATINISLLDVNEVPAISNQAFTLNENSANGMAVGTVTATDPDAGQTKTFSILSGNTNNAFTINSSTGALSVATSSALDYEVAVPFALVIKVQDNGTGSLSSQATITISLLDVNEIPAISNQAFTLSENSANGMAAGTITANDPDSGQTLAYSILSGNISGAFAIIASTGAITVSNAAALDFEVNPSFSLVVKAQDNGSGSLSNQAMITIDLLDINEAPAMNNQVFSVSENSSIGTFVGTLNATDPDADQTLSYSIISGNTDGAFGINASTGELSVANPVALNILINPSFALIVSAQDDGTGNLSCQANISVLLSNTIEPPHIPNQTYWTAEHQPTGTLVSTIFVSNPEAGQTFTFSITAGNFGNGFTIDPANGNLTIQNPASVCFEGHPVFALSIKVQDNYGLSGEAAITIVLTDINENPVCQSQVFGVDENAVAQTLLGTITATDPDFNQTLTYSITAGNSNNAFIIDANSGELIVNNPAALDFELTPSYSLIVTVQDNGPGSLTSQMNVTVNLNNLNETPSINEQILSVNENTVNGTLVGTVSGTDPDAGQILAYSIQSGNTDGAFSINSSTGAISVANSAALVYLTNPTFSLNVSVTDNGVGNLQDIASITINVIQSINQVPVINNQSFSVNENTMIGISVGTVAASDPDAGQTLTYSILSGNTNGGFTINSSTGLLKVANSAALNYESTPTFSLIIKVQDNGQGTLSGTATVTVKLNNINEYPVIAGQIFSVKKFAPKGTVVGTVKASDPDAGQLLSYAITAGNTSTAFAINSSTGKIKVNNKWALNYTTTPVFKLTVRVKDNGTGLLASYAIITINVINSKSANSINIISVPQEIASVGSLYSYEVSGFSEDGTTIHYSAKEIPAWLSFKDNENGTGIFEGTPGIEDIGFHQIVLTGNADIQQVDQVFMIEVKSASVNGLPDQAIVGMHIYPNPVINSNLNVKLDEGMNDQFDLLITDASGKLIMKRHYEQTKSISLDLSAYPMGMYFLQVRSLNFQKSEKFVLN